MIEDIVIVSPHYDDEFIGCFRLFEKYKNDITDVIFFTDSSLQTVYIDTTSADYILKRYNESYCFISAMSPKAKIHRLDIPDGLNPEEFVKKTFFDRGMQGIHDAIAKLFKKILRNRKVILAIPTIDSDHPSHMWCSAIFRRMGRNLNLKIIEYQTHQLFNEPPIKHENNQILETKTNNCYIYTVYHQIGKKSLLFKKIYPTQWERFNAQNMKLYDWERYYSDIPLDLKNKNG